MMTPHFAFCVCILLVLKPLRAFRGNQESGFKAKELREAGFLAEDLREAAIAAEDPRRGGFSRKQILKVEENYQEAFDIVYGMEMGDAMRLLQESQNENLKGLFSDLHKLGYDCRNENVLKVTAQATGDCNPLNRAASHGLLRLAEALIRKGADVNPKDNSGGTPLMYAARKGHDKVVKLLLQKGADPNAKNKYGLTTLYLATASGNYKVVELLKAAIAAEDARRPFSRKQILKVEENYQEAFDIVYGMEMGDAMRLLQESQNENLKGLFSDLHKLGYDCRNENVLKVTAQATGDCNPLDRAASHGLLRLAEALIRKGADVNAKDTDDQTPLHWAAKKGQDKMAELLLHKGADVEAKNRYGSAPLHFAAMNGHDKVVKLLLQKGADPNAKTKYGLTTLALATASGNYKVVELLKAAGA